MFSPGNSWVEVILSETHDFSRAVDGLVKEMYLGMIFLQLQVTLVCLSSSASFFFSVVIACCLNLTKWKGQNTQETSPVVIKLK